MAEAELRPAGVRILVAGAGALGTCYAVLLARAGADVCVLTRPERVAALQRGLRVSGLVEATAEVEVVGHGREAVRADYVLVATKTQDTAPVLASLAGIEAGAVFSLQNGVAKDDALAAAFGAQRVIGAACAVGAGLLAPGHAQLTMNQGTWVGELEWPGPERGPERGSLGEGGRAGGPGGVGPGRARRAGASEETPDGGTSERVVRLAAALRAAGFPTWSVPDIRAVEWYKLCALLPGAMITALARRSYAEMALHPHLSRLFVQIMRETFAVVQAQGIAVTDPPGSLWRFSEWLPAPDDVALAGLQAIGERQRASGERMLPSMLQDVLAGRRTEVEDLAGEVLRQALALDVPVPATQTCYRLLRGLEDGFADAP